MQKEVSYPSKTNFDKLFLFLSRIHRLIGNIDSAGVQLQQLFSKDAGFAPLEETKSLEKLQEKMRMFFVNLEILGSFDSLDSTQIIDYAVTRRQALAQFKNVVS